MAEMGPEARRLRRVMEERGMSARDLVRLTGLNKNTFSDMFSGKTQRPYRGTLERIEVALGLTPDTLSGSGEEPAVLGHARLGSAVLGADLSGVSSDELVAELSERLRVLQRRVRDLEGRGREDASATGSVDEVGNVRRLRRGAMPVDEAAYDGSDGDD